MKLNRDSKKYESIPKPMGLVNIPSKDFKLLDRDIKLAYASGIEDFNLQITAQTLVALYKARKSLERDEQLIIKSAYRPPKLQAELWRRRVEDIKNSFPSLDEQEIISLASLYTASPEHPKFPPHMRGDALDVSLSRKDIILEMYLEPFSYDQMQFDYFENKNKEIHENRLYLRRVMQAAGFFPYDKEFWHFGLTPVWPEERT